jgi:hypothetical protein
MLTLVMSSPQPVHAAIVDGPVPRWTVPAFAGAEDCSPPVVVGSDAREKEAGRRVSDCVVAVRARAEGGISAQAMTVPLAVARRTYFPIRVPFDQDYINGRAD